MTFKSLVRANKAAGYENNDMPGAFVPIPEQIRVGLFGTAVVSPVDDSEHTSIDYLNERHCQDTETIHQLQLQLKQEKERGNNFCDRMITAERLYREENAKVINLQSEVKKQDEALIRYAKLEDYLFQTMQVAQDQREKYLRECGELDE